MKEMKSKKKTLPRLHWISEFESRICEVRLYDIFFMGRDPMEVDDWVTDLNPNSVVVRA